MNRRNILQAAATGLLGAPVAPPAVAGGTSPDAALIADCEAFIAEDTAWLALVNQLGELCHWEPRYKELQAEMDALVFDSWGWRERLGATPATTLEGMQAKARAIAADWCNEPADGADLAWSLMQDVLRMGGGA